MTISNEDNIKKWSSVSQDEIEKFGNGDFGRTEMLNPAIFQLIGDVKNKKILDAGSGTGYLARMLARKGAKVTAVEPGKSMYEYAVSREQTEKLGITYYQEDLSKFIQYTDTFDSVVANMVFMDIPDYQSAMKNCILSLKKSGLFIYSLLHPCFPGFEKDWQKLHHVEVDDYFKESVIEAKYGQVFYRPLQNYLNLTNDYGCVTERIIEPQLTKEFAGKNPNNSRSHYVPQFIVIKARREK